MSKQSASGSGPAGRMSLPARSTRGKRMAAAMDDEGADEQFWNQEFFAEEAQDIDYQTEDEEEDVPDSDFDEPEEEDDDDEEGRDVDERPKKKALKAPEPKGPPKLKAPKPPAASKPKDGEGSEQPPKKKQAVESSSPIPADQLVYAAPTLRRSTMARVAQAEVRRAEQVRAQTSRPPPRKSAGPRPLTQAELLAEAARTEIDNMYSLKMLLAMEEATKKKAQVVKQQYHGPLVRLSSRRRVAITQPGPPPEHQAAQAPTPYQQAAQAPPPQQQATQAQPQDQQTAQAATAGGASQQQAERAAQPAGGAGGGGGGLGAAAQQPADVHIEDASGSQAAAVGAAGAQGANTGPSQQQQAAAGAQGASTGPSQQQQAAGPAAAAGVGGEQAGKDTGAGAGASGAAAGDHSRSAAGAASQDPGGSEAGGKEGTKGDEKKKDNTVYEATLVYELHNMHYPPLWLRRFRAPPPPVPPLCLVSGAPARYRDPETSVCFSSVAAYRRIKGLAPPPFPPSGPPPPLPLSQAPFNRASCAFQGAPLRQALSAASQRALAALPPEPAALPPPSTQFPLVQPNTLAGPLMALVADTATA